MNTTTTELEYSQIIAVCKGVFENKTKDYGTAWRVMRISALTDQILSKVLRIRTIQEKPRMIKVDDITEDLISVVNYSIFALMQISLAHDPRLHIPYDEVSAHYDKVVERSMSLLVNKDHDYGEAWRMMRVSSIVDIIYMRLLRIKEIENNNGYTVVSEGIESNYQDIMNYGVFSLILLSKL